MSIYEKQLAAGYFSGLPDTGSLIIEAIIGKNMVTGLLQMTALLITGPSDELQQSCLSSADCFLSGYTKGIMPFQS